MLKIGKNEICVLMAIHFLSKVEKKEECKNKDIVTCAFEYTHFRLWNVANGDTEELYRKSDQLFEDRKQGYYYNDINVAINRLMKKELIVRTKRAYYTLTEKGKAELTVRVLRSQDLHETLTQAI